MRINTFSKSLPNFKELKAQALRSGLRFEVEARLPGRREFAWVATKDQGRDARLALEDYWQCFARENGLDREVAVYLRKI